MNKTISSEEQTKRGNQQAHKQETETDGQFTKHIAFQSSYNAAPRGQCYSKTAFGSETQSLKRRDQSADLPESQNRFTVYTLDGDDLLLQSKWRRDDIQRQISCPLTSTQSSMTPIYEITHFMAYNQPLAAPPTTTPIYPVYHW